MPAAPPATAPVAGEVHAVERHAPHRDAVHDRRGDVTDDRARNELRHCGPHGQEVPRLGRSEPLVVRLDVGPSPHRDEAVAQAPDLVVGVPACE